MSTNHTPNFGLSQWIGSDPVLMADFNADNGLIDSALKSLQTAVEETGREIELNSVKMAVGSYVGDHVWGEDTPKSISVDFMPLLVIVRREYNITSQPTGVGVVMIRPMETTAVQAAYSLSSDHKTTDELHVVWSDRGVSWYWDNGQDNNTGANMQMNYRNNNYYWVALGV